MMFSGYKMASKDTRKTRLSLEQFHLYLAVLLT